MVFAKNTGLFDLLYADDMVIICESADVIREAVARLEQATHEAGLTISMKTKYLIIKIDNRTKPDMISRSAVTR